MQPTVQTFQVGKFVGRTEVAKTLAVASQIEIAQNTLSPFKSNQKETGVPAITDLLRYGLRYKPRPKTAQLARSIGSVTEPAENSI